MRHRRDAVFTAYVPKIRKPILLYMSGFIAENTLIFYGAPKILKFAK